MIELPADFIKTLDAKREGPDCVLFEDKFVKVYRENNEIYMIGKPLKWPFKEEVKE